MVRRKDERKVKIKKGWRLKNGYGKKLWRVKIGKESWRIKEEMRMKNEKKGWRIKKGWKGKMREDEELKYIWEEEYGKWKRKLEKWKLMWNERWKR